MISRAEFDFLCTQGWPAFWAVAKGRTPNAAAIFLRDWQVALHVYAKRHHGNGKPDERQLRAMDLERQLHMKLLRFFINRRKPALMRQGMAPPAAKVQAHQEAEGWLKRASY